MIKCIILEDEPSALQRLERLIKDCRPNYNIIDTADSVEEALKVLQSQTYDLIFSDIQLSDGMCFEVLEKLKVEKPIIFITAFDQYALKAFQYNGLHYLLKPINRDQLLDAILKFEKKEISNISYNALQQQFISLQTQHYQKRFISKVGSKLKIIDTQNIALFYTNNLLTHALLFEGKTSVLDANLEQILSQLNPEQFFRINRQMIVNIDAIQDMVVYSSNRLKLSLSVYFPEEIIVSKEKSVTFKNWLSSH